MAEPLAAAGQAEALALLGLIARDAIPPDIDTARAYLRNAAASGSLTAEAALGRAYQLGQLGLPPDTARACIISSAPPLQEAAWRRST
jgi:TPR repeat protein